jgi:hypothetical protein
MAHAKLMATLPSVTHYCYTINQKILILTPPSAPFTGHVTYQYIPLSNV